MPIFPQKPRSRSDRVDRLRAEHAFAQRMQPKQNDPIKPVIRRQATVLSVDFDPFGAPVAVTINLQGTMIPGVRFLAGYVPKEGDVVIVDITNDDPLVIGTLHSDPTLPEPAEAVVGGQDVFLLGDTILAADSLSTGFNRTGNLIRGNPGRGWSNPAISTLEIFAFGQMTGTSGTTPKPSTQFRMTLNGVDPSFVGTYSHMTIYGRSGPLAGDIGTVEPNFQYLSPFFNFSLFDTNATQGGSNGQLKMTFMNIDGPLVTWIAENRYVAYRQNPESQAWEMLRWFNTQSGEFHAQTPGQLDSVSFSAVTGDSQFKSGSRFVCYGRK